MWQRILKFIFIITLCIFTFTGGLLINIWQKSLKSKNAFLNLEKDKIASQNNQEQPSPNQTPLPFISPYQAVFAQNQDMIAWIEIPSSSLSYPVMHTPENPNFYLRRDFEKQYSDYGVPYLAENCDIDTSDNLIVYGHNFAMGKMFGLLMKYRNEDFYSNNPLIIIDTKTQTRYYRIFAVCLVTALSPETDVFPYYDFTKANSEQAYTDYIENAKKYALYDTGFTPQDQQLLTLSTCEYSQPHGRLIVCAFLEKTVA